MNIEHGLIFNPKNLLFYYDGEQSSKPAGVIFLEVGTKIDIYSDYVPNWFSN